MISASLLISYAAVLAAVGGRYLAHAEWVGLRPRLAIACWQALSAAVLLIGVLGVVSLGFGRTSAGGVLAFLDLCLGTMAGASTGGASALEVLSVALMLTMAARLAWVALSSLLRQSRDRRRLRATVSLLGRRDPSLGAMVLEDAAPYAFCVPGGRRGGVVLTRGLLTTLSAEEVDAVLHHERAHLSQHHAWLTTFASVLSRGFGRLVPMFRQAEREVTRLVELCADDAAARVVGKDAVRRALVGLVPGRPIPGALAASGGAVAHRLARLQRTDAGRARRVSPSALFFGSLVLLPVVGSVLGLVLTGSCATV